MAFQKGLCSKELDIFETLDMCGIVLQFCSTVTSSIQMYDPALC
jgi:hypothetical protein